MFSSAKKRHGSKKRALPFAGLCFILPLFIFAGCALGASEKPNEANEPSGAAAERTQEPTPLPQYALGKTREPVRLLLEEYSCGAYKVRRPEIYEDGAELLSYSIKEAFDAFALELTAEGLRGSIDFTVRCNDRGLLAFVITAYGEGGKEQSRTAACFDCGTGGRIGLSACFGSGDESYRFALADVVTERLTAAGNSVISFLPPMDDDRLFYFDEEGLTLVYRRYEVCDAEAGMPEVFLSYEELEGYLNPDALLLRLPYFDR